MPPAASQWRAPLPLTLDPELRPGTSAGGPAASQHGTATTPAALQTDRSANIVILLVGLEPLAHDDHRFDEVVLGRAEDLLAVLLG